MDNHLYPCGVDNDATVGIMTMAVSQQHGMACETATTTKNYVACLQSGARWHNTSFAVNTPTTYDDRQ